MIWLTGLPSPYLWPLGERWRHVYVLDIGKIKQVPLREIWKREDSDFTVWLENNIDYLNDVLDFEVSIEEREKRVGSFSLDLYGDDGLGGKVIIEKQLEKTDHDHLGKVLTYLTNLDASR